jgi:glycine hydroxymethyltransferase
LCKTAFAKELDKLTFPGIQGGPLVHTIAAKAVCLKEAMEPTFREYQQQVARNAKALAAAIAKRGLRVVSGGTDNHLLLVEVHSRGITGNDAEKALDRAGITVNKNSIPFDPLPPMKAGGDTAGDAVDHYAGDEGSGDGIDCGMDCGSSGGDWECGN